jgi:hypothetical protein
MQKDRQAFRNMQDLRQHGFDMIKMRERDRLAGMAGDPTESENTLDAQMRIRKSQRDDRKLRLDEWKAGQSVFTNRIDFLETELRGMDIKEQLSDPKRKQFIEQQLRRAQTQLNSWLLENPPPHQPGVSKTIREENEEFQRLNEQQRFFQSRPYPMGPSEYGNEAYNRRYRPDDVVDERTNKWYDFRIK